MLARFQAQLEQYPAPWISQEQRLLQDRNQPRLLAQLNPCRSPRRSMSASTTRPIRHSAPSSLSVVTRSHEVDLIHSWRADSLAFVWLDPGITPCCRSPLQAFLVSDSVAVKRFATGAEHDGAAQPRPRAVFYSFRLDEAVPQDHPVREVAAVLDLSWVHSELAPYYP